MQPATDLKRSESTLNLPVAIVAAFLANFDYLVILPLIPLAAQRGVTLPAATLSFALALRATVATVSSPLYCAVAGNRSRRMSLSMASTLKAAGFCLLSLGVSAGTLLAFAVLTGLGSGIFRPIVRLVVSDLPTRSARERAFHKLNVAMNLALVVGPLMAELLRRMQSLSVAFVAIAALESAVGLISWALLTETKSAADGEHFPQDAASQSDAVGGMYLQQPSGS